MAIAQPLIVLIQEDPYLIATRKKLLESNGYRVHVVRGVNEARARCRELACDLVIVDSDKAHHTSIELCDEIKQNNPALRVAVMTGYHVFVRSECPDEIIKQEDGPAVFLDKIRSLLTPREISA
jgi:DNA-binding NtrC family response regulator